MINPLPRCPYCDNLPFQVIIAQDGIIYHRSVWNSCRCEDFAEDMEKVRDEYVQELMNRQELVNNLSEEE